MAGAGCWLARRGRAGGLAADGPLAGRGPCCWFAAGRVALGGLLAARFWLLAAYCRMAASGRLLASWTLAGQLGVSFSNECI